MNSINAPHEAFATAPIPIPWNKNAPTPASSRTSSPQERHLHFHNVYGSESSGSRSPSLSPRLRTLQLEPMEPLRRLASREPQLLPVPEFVSVENNIFRRLPTLPNYATLPEITLTPQQVALVPKYDLSLMDRALHELVDPVAVVMGSEAPHVYPCEDLFEFWRTNKLHPHFGLPATEANLFRVVNER